ncbi:hypothetical protein SAMN05216604_1382 [Pseudomonas agarici]|nr:hypothetical protein SAMN05216604_1382 [Pseudomonas agarici]
MATKSVGNVLVARGLFLYRGYSRSGRSKYIVNLPAMQSSFSDLEYAAKKKRTRRDRFLAEIDAVTPWQALITELEPFYPKGLRRMPCYTARKRLRSVTQGIRASNGVKNKAV